MDDDYQTCVAFLLGYPGVGKRTVGSHLAELLNGVLVDNQLINIPLLTLFKWDGKSAIPMEIWDRVKPIREAVLGTIEDLAPQSNSHVFTNVLKDDEEGASQYQRIRSLAHGRGSLFLSAMLDCDVDEQVRRIDNPDRIARLKGSDPGCSWQRPGASSRSAQQIISGRISARSYRRWSGRSGGRSVTPHGWDPARNRVPPVQPPGRARVLPGTWICPHAGFS